MYTEEEKRKAYNRYQLEWMLSHGKSIEDFYDALRICIRDEYNEFFNESGTTPDDDDVDQIMINAMNHFCMDAGFDGELWDCYDEFIHTEFEVFPEHYLDL